jgi:aminopeptidase N
VLASSGVEVDRQESESMQRVIYAAGPARDFYLAGSRAFIPLEKTVGDLTVRVLTREEFEAHQHLALEVGWDVIEIFSERIGDYPYTEFEIITSPMMALGIEYPGITSLEVSQFHVGESMFGTPTEVMLETTLAHEAAHMWFYNTVGNDQQHEPWLDESLVQYLTYIYYLDKYGNGQGYIDSWYGSLSLAEDAETAIGLPAGDYLDTEYGIIVYNRGPIFFLELEKTYGLDMVMSALQSYYQDHLWGVGQPEDMLATLESACQCELDEFFNDWVYGK